MPPSLLYLLVFLFFLNTPTLWKRSSHLFCSFWFMKSAAVIKLTSIWSINKEYVLDYWNVDSFTDKSLILLNPSLEANGDSFHLSAFFCDLWSKAGVRSHLPGWVGLYGRVAARRRLCVCALMPKMMWVKLEKCVSPERWNPSLITRSALFYWFQYLFIWNPQLLSFLPFVCLTPSEWHATTLSLWSTGNHPPGAAALVGDPVVSPPPPVSHAQPKVKHQGAGFSLFSGFWSTKVG